jgi:hypothetical protein
MPWDSRNTLGPVGYLGCAFVCFVALVAVALRVYAVGW